ncbi:MAG: cysteine desulfurase family protein, partial [Anaerolineales bacterium]
MMEQKKRIYLDYAASTPVDKRVIQIMLPYFAQIFGNSSSVHFGGQAAEAAIEQARKTIAGLINADPEEIIFTSGGTESDNLAIKGVAFARRRDKGCNHLLISPVEHPAVLQSARQLSEVFGFEIEYLPVDSFGRVDPSEVAVRLRPDTALVSVIYGNNEIGTINDIASIGNLCRAKGIPFHTDAVQAAAHLPIDVVRESIDLLSIGSHKFYGPKGVGVLYVRKGIHILPMITGGAHENNLRAGTHNTPYI